MPMPGEVEGASAGPGLPGPTSSFTTHTSVVAVGVVGVGVPDSSSASPVLKDLTSSTVVLASGLKPLLIESSQLNLVWPGGKTTPPPS